ncbi:MAG: outer membrane protein transport protein [Ignavibacteriaceae bacterium]
MLKRQKKLIFVQITIFLFLLISSSQVYSQHRGDALSFQGFDQINGTGVKVEAMGGANLALFGDVSAIFNNPAGLAGINGYQFSVSANSFEKNWRENQDYRPNRQFVTLPFYLEGYYVPDPKNNGKFDNKTFFSDTNYIVSDPKLGLDPYSEAAADWKVKKSGFSFNNVSAAVPFKLFDRQFVAATAYNKRYNVLDYDRDQTYLDPHIGFAGYGGLVPRVTAAGDSVRVNWYDYIRSRDGNIEQVNIALASDVTKFLKVGFSANISSGETNDYNSLDKIGYFDLIGGANNFKFSYDYLNTVVKGTSKFTSTSFNIGAIIVLDRFNLAIKVTPPYTLERKWNYTLTISDTNGIRNENLSGVDDLKLPIGYSFGLSFNPVDQFVIAFDLEKSSYSKSTVTLATPDTNFRNWADQTIIRVGVEYKVLDYLSLLAGYRNTTTLFVPDGAATEDQGPNSTNYSAGISLNFFFGRFDFAYEKRIMKYFDSYFSNTNYSTETYDNFLFGYTLSL